MSTKSLLDKAKKLPKILGYLSIKRISVILQPWLLSIPEINNKLFSLIKYPDSQHHFRSGKGVRKNIPNWEVGGSFPAPPTLLRIRVVHEGKKGDRLKAFFWKSTDHRETAYLMLLLQSDRSMASQTQVLFSSSR